MVFFLERVDDNVNARQDRFRVYCYFGLDMHFQIAAIGAGLFIFCQGVVAQTVGYGLVHSNNCTGCHRIDEKEGRKRLGPDFEVVARRYQGSAAAIPYLASRIRSGARGSWGAVPMPAQSQISQADAELMAAWVLSLSGDPDVGAGQEGADLNTQSVAPSAAKGNVTEQAMQTHEVISQEPVSSN